MARKRRAVIKGARAVAALVVADVLAGKSLTDSLARRLPHVPDKDRGLVSDLTYGVCRWFFRLNAVAGLLLNKPMKQKDQDVLALLLIGLYQLQFSRVPEHAAVAETAGAARELGKDWAVAMLNATLRRFQREEESLLTSALKQPTARYSQPQWFIDAMRTAWPDDWSRLLESLLQHPPMTLRVNLDKTTMAETVQAFERAGIAANPVDTVVGALVLDKPIDVHAIPGFDQGLVSVQDAGAQLAAKLLQLEPGQTVLDACAAPGGKTGHILEQAPDISLLALDVDEQRLQRVEQNLQRLGYAAEIMAGDASLPAGEWSQRSYDRILLDAPCSATGVMRRHPDIRLLRRAADIEQLQKKQAAILDALWPLLKPGGKLLYVTCSLLPAENDQQIEAFVARHNDVLAEALPDEWGHKRGHGRQTLPGEDSMDGFFYARLCKQQIEEAS